MESIVHSRRARAGLDDLLQLLSTPGRWLDPFAQIAAARGERAGLERLDPARRRVLRLDKHDSSLTIGTPHVDVDAWIVRFPIQWANAGFEVLFGELEGSVTLTPAGADATILEMQGTCVTGDEAGRHAAEVAIKMLVDMIVLAVEARERSRA